MTAKVWGMGISESIFVQRKLGDLNCRRCGGTLDEYTGGAASEVSRSRSVSSSDSVWSPVTDPLRPSGIPPLSTSSYVKLADVAGGRYIQLLELAT